MGCSSNEVWGGDDNTQTGAEGARLEDLDKKGKLLLRRRRAETHTGHLYHFLIQFPLARWNTSSRSLPRVETELSLNIQQNSGPLSAGGSKREQNPKYSHEHNCLFRLVRLGDNQTDCTGPCLPRFSSMNQCKWEEKHGQQGGQKKKMIITEPLQKGHMRESARARGPAGIWDGWSQLGTPEFLGQPQPGPNHSVPLPAGQATVDSRAGSWALNSNLQ